MHISVDLDGTVFENNYPDIGEILPNTKETINYLYERGHKIVINTCRALHYAENAKAFLIQKGIKYDFFNENDTKLIERYGTDVRKISADVYLDDKSLNEIILRKMMGEYEYNNQFWQTALEQIGYIEKPCIICIVGESGCFTKGQRILTSDGHKEISKIKVGDKVLSYNHDIGTNEFRTVNDVHRYNVSKDKLYKIKLKDGTYIKVTENHKFFDGRNYIKIKDLLLQIENKPLDGEVFKTIPGFSSYECSNKGRIKTYNWKNTGKERIMKPAPDPDGYLKTMLKNDKGKIGTIKVHRIVATTFIPNPQKKATVNHKNGIKTDNSVANLEWATVQENNRHAFENNLMTILRGELNGRTNLTDAEVVEIRKNYISDRMVKGRLTKRDIAKKYNTSFYVIKSIVQGRTWKHLL